MKPFKKALILACVCINSRVESSEPHGFLKDEFTKRLAVVHQKTPRIRAELRKQYPDPTAANARELYSVVTLRSLMLQAANKYFTNLSTDPWVRSEDSTIWTPFQKNVALQMPPQDTATFRAVHDILAQQTMLYKAKLDERHPPQACRICPKGFWNRKPRCHVLHQEYDALLPALALLGQAAQLESRDPELLSKYAKLDPEMGKRKTAQESKE